MQRLILLVAAFIMQTIAALSAEPRTVWLDELELSHIQQGWGVAQAKQSVEGNALRLDGTVYQRGVGSHAPAAIHLRLDGKANSFHALVGVDDEVGEHGSITFKIYGDGKKIFTSDVLRGGRAPQAVDLDLAGVRELVLVLGNGGDDINHDHANLAEARFLVTGADPRVVPAPVEKPVILTPQPPKEPRINGPKIFGVRPGSPFLFRIPATGVRPLRYAVNNLPAGLTVNPKTGIITGRIEDRTPSIYRTTLLVDNTHGRAAREFRILVGDTLALTPPMGWNSWYIHYHRVSDQDMRAAADAMVESGMADLGYAYVNIDDCWMRKRGAEQPRDGDGAILPNEKFPDMNAMTDYIHGKGLKAGLYTSPGPWTCAGYTGSYQHEELDARKFAAWGFDFLKYDWCSYGGVAGGSALAQMKKPYRRMGDILKTLDRDIIFNLCQYGMADVWRWGGEVGGNCWRTTGDLGLVGGQLSRGIYQIGLHNATLYEYARPGQWNDPDYLLIGYVGDARNMGEGRPTPLTPHEQYTHMSMWCLMAAPLIFSGDMTRLDPFTLNILCNAEVIEVDQDPLGRQARIVAQSEEQFILAKEMEDGSRAVGLFNLSEVRQDLRVSWADLKIQGRQRIRDLWCQRDLGVFEERFEASVGRHGVVLIRIRMD